MPQVVCQTPLCIKGIGLQHQFDVATSILAVDGVKLLDETQTTFLADDKSNFVKSQKVSELLK